jgi:hypothetical protein
MADADIDTREKRIFSHQIQNLMRNVILGHSALRAPR